MGSPSVFAATRSASPIPFGKCEELSAGVANDSLHLFSHLWQQIGETARRQRELFIQTLRDIAAGPSGWRDLRSDLHRGAQALTGGEGGFRRALLNPSLIAGAPVAFLRGPLASPGFFLAVFSSLTGLQLIVEAMAPPEIATAANDVEQVCGHAGMGLVIFGTCILGPAQQALQAAATAAFAAALLRMGLVGLIEERNVVLARNIRAACAAPARASGARETSPVVAVMGLAHVDGVKRLLESEHAAGNLGEAVLPEAKNSVSPS